MSYYYAFSPVFTNTCMSFEKAFLIWSIRSIVIHKQVLDKLKPLQKVFYDMYLHYIHIEYDRTMQVLDDMILKHFLGNLNQLTRLKKRYYCIK